MLPGKTPGSKTAPESLQGLTTMHSGATINHLQVPLAVLQCVRSIHPQRIQAASAGQSAANERTNEDRSTVETVPSLQQQQQLAVERTASISIDACSLLSNTLLVSVSMRTACWSIVVPECMVVKPGKNAGGMGCSMCGSHSCNQEELLNSDWWRACDTMSQHFPGKNPGKLPGNFLRTPNDPASKEQVQLLADGSDSLVLCRCRRRTCLAMCREGHCSRFPDAGDILDEAGALVW